MNSQNSYQLEIYSEETLQRVKEYSALFLNPVQICRLLDLKLTEFKADIRKPEHPLRVAYEKGKFETVLELRKQEIDLAKLGSPMAIELVNSFIIEQKQSER